jgi:Flp pilus assembly protein TadG
MVELAVVLPLLILLAIGVMDYGRVFFTSITVANAARAGAEWGAQNQANSVKTSDLENFAKLDGAEAGTLVVTSSRTCKCGGTDFPCATTPSCAGYGVPRVYIAVTVTKDVALLIKYPGLPTTVTIARTATFRLQ